MKKVTLKSICYCIFLQTWRFRFFAKKRKQVTKVIPCIFPYMLKYWSDISLQERGHENMLPFLHLLHLIWTTKMPTTIRGTKQATHVTMCHLPRCFETAVLADFGIGCSDWICFSMIFNGVWYLHFRCIPVNTVHIMIYVHYIIVNIIIYGASLAVDGISKHSNISWKWRDCYWDKNTAKPTTKSRQSSPNSSGWTL